MTTAMQELRLIIELYDDNDTRRNLLAWIDKLGLPKEKQQIVDAYKTGGKSFADFDYTSTVMDREATDYFSETYTQYTNKQKQS